MNVKKVLIFVLAISAVVMAQGKSNAGLPRIAVYVTGDVGDNEKKALGTRMLTTLVKSGRYRSIERGEAFLAEIAKEHVTQRSGAIDEEQIKRLGKQFAIEYICIADITPAFGEFQVSARIVDVETAEVVMSGDASGSLQSMADLERVSEKTVNSMFDRETAAAPTPRTEPAYEPAPTPYTSNSANQSPQPRETYSAPSSPSRGYSSDNKLGGVSVGVGLTFANDVGAGLSGAKDPAAGKWSYTIPWTGFGAHVFLDLVYVEAGLSVIGGGGEHRVTNYEGKEVEPEGRYEVSFTVMGISALLKYPVEVGSNVLLYPAAGIDYALMLSGKSTNDDGSYGWEESGEKPGDFNALWFKFGGGADVALTGKMFLRAEVLYGFRTSCKYEVNWLEDTEETTLGYGLTIRAGVGFGF